MPGSTVDLPVVSVITVVRNCAATILQTLDSVQAQRYRFVEHIVIDGASTDGTIDVIKAYSGDRLHWISGSDLGIYDAMNKGISLARGEWLLFLGADDILADSLVLADIFQTKTQSAYDLICGCSSYHDGRKCTPHLDWRTLVFNTIHHQAAFYRRSLFDHFRYRLDIPVVADYELNFRIYLQRLPVLLLDRQVAISGCLGVSYVSSPLRAQIDAYRIRGRYLNPLVNAALLIAGLMNLMIVRAVDLRRGNAG